MGHDVIDCPDCGRWIMEGHRDWKCKCGWYMDTNVLLHKSNETLKKKKKKTTKKKGKK